MRIRYNHQTGAKTYIDDDGYRTDANSKRLADEGAVRGPTVIGDISEFVSPLDMSVISSRSSLREHEKRHGVKQCGELNKVSDYDNDPAPRHDQNYRQNPLRVDVDFQWTE